MQNVRRFNAFRLHAITNIYDMFKTFACGKKLVKFESVLFGYLYHNRAFPILRSDFNYYRPVAQTGLVTEPPHSWRLMTDSAPQGCSFQLVFSEMGDAAQSAPRLTV